ncbi:Vacuolar protein sorting/targeting protein VPS10 [Rhizoctonia solani]|uniref:Vacuolar protein sorting/targeting protein 10 n=1 Tax=Rhizoctonia solani TaxID=456999 RepID=A0A8H7LI41_9AGAM|nr:Vacuolar protein sorting/targeting protein VPS10 [Rhizoctonia solani]
MWAKRFALPLLLFLGASAQKPNVKTTRFENLPKNMFYFEDASAVLYHDSAQANVYLSEDEGKNWSKVKGVPDGHALVLVQHPFNNRMAFILGDKVTHWRTMDRGRMWQSFEMPHPIAFVPAPLSFHSDEKNSEWIMMQVCTHTNDSNVLHSLALAPTLALTLALTLAPKVRECKKSAWGWSETCFGSTYYTLDAFSSGAKLLTRNSFKCIFAHSSSIRTISSGSHKKIGFAPKRPPSQVFCVAFDKNAADGSTNARSSRLFTSSDWFDKETELIDFGLGQRASRGVTAIGIMSKFMVAALRDPSGKSHELQLQVTLDGYTWHKAQFPHASSSKLLENAYTIVESTSHSLAVDVLLHSDAAVGTLFVSNSNGTFFVESLVDTNRNRAGFVDFEDLVGVEGVGIANYVKNAPAVEGHKAAKQSPAPWVADVWAGRTWDPLDPPDDSDCRSGSRETCALHLYSVSTPHNIGKVFSSPAPGLVLGVGSVGTHLRPYEECDTYMSRDAGLTWKRVQKGAHMYEVGDQGAVTVLVDDEEYTKQVKYSWDEGNTWQTVDLGVEIRARVLTTVPDSTSLTFILLGSLSREDAKGPGGRYVAIHLDFEPAKVRKCESDDFEKWYARTLKGKECLMGHKQWYKRRKENAKCYVGDKFNEAPEHEENCPCEDEDYECPIVSDYNYIRQNNQCVAAGPEPIPVDVCKSNSPGEKYLGSSGYRLIPGNTCDRDKGIKKDEKIQKDCSEAQKPPGEVSHQVKFFKRPIVGNWHFQKAGTILVQLDDGTVHQSSNEGYSWTQLVNGEYIIAVYMHLYADDRAYLITNKDKLYYTTDTAQQWLALDLPAPPNQFGLGLLSFHPLQSDWLIYTGQTNCGSDKTNCHVEAYYTLNHGRTWTSIEKYVKTCTWARTANLRIDQHLILCESYRDKKGNQLSFANNPLEFIEGSEYFKNKRKMFDNVVGFAKFSEYLLVAEVKGQSNALDLQVSLDGRSFAMGKFPPGMSVDNHAYTVLESSTDSVFLHVTMSDKRGAEWGNVLKSNSNGTYYGLSLEAVNRNAQGYVDFEKLVGLDGIAVMNIVANTKEVEHTGKKKLQTRISHNDGGTWKKLVPPPKDSLGQNYECSGTNCALHIHGYTERYDARAKYSSPSAIGLMMGVGSVSEHLAPYKDSDTFLSRDGGFTWEEVHKDAHLFSFGDSGSVIVIVNDEEPTDHVLYTTNEGTSWREYKFSDERLRIRSIVTKPTETSRKFVLLGHKSADRDTWVAIQLDFSAITSRQCLLNPDDPNKDDFELWSPSEEREERCLFGRQVQYHRRLRDRDCYVGDQPKIEQRIVKNCACMKFDFECEFNYVRNSAGDCVLTPGAEPLPNDDTCPGDASVWYERTAYRKIPHSSCEGGDRKDRGPEHPCPGIGSHGYLFWGFVVMIPIIFAGLVGLHFKKHGFATGAIRLPDNTGRQSWDDGGIVSTLASIPVAIVAVSRGVWARVSTLLPGRRGPRYPTRGGYRTVAVDEDAQVLRFEDDD